MADNTINVTIKLSGKGEKFDFQLDTTHSVEQVIDDILKTKPALNKDEVTLVRKGRILKTNQVIKEVGVAEGETLFLVNKASSESKDEDAKKEEEPAAAQTDSAPQGFPGMFGGIPGMGMPGMSMPGMGGFGMPGMGMPGMGGFGMPGMGMPGMGMPGMGAPGGFPGMQSMFNPEMIANILDNPMIKNMMNEMFSDPEKLKDIIAANPMLGEMAEGNPEIQEMISNPEKLKEAMGGDKMDEALKGMKENLKNFQSQNPTPPGVTGATSGDDNDNQDFPGDPMQMFQNMMGPGGMGMPGMPGGMGLQSMMDGVDPEMLKQMMEGFNLSAGSEDQEADKDKSGDKPKDK